MYDKDAQALIRENASLLEENANLRNLLRTEEALYLKKRSPFVCQEPECQRYTRPVYAGDCHCYQQKAEAHRKAVWSAIANPYT